MTIAGSTAPPPSCWFVIPADHNWVRNVLVAQILVEALRRIDPQLPAPEPGLSELVRRNTAPGRLLFTTDTAAAVAGAEIVFVAVGTPGVPANINMLEVYPASPVADTGISD